MALWKAARLNDQKWFVALLVINLVGILEILYIYFFSKKKEKAAAPQV
jgi:methionyl-tRNA synthetase